MTKLSCTALVVSLLTAPAIAQEARVYDVRDLVNLTAEIEPPPLGVWRPATVQPVPVKPESNFKLEMARWLVREFPPPAETVTSHLVSGQLILKGDSKVHERLGKELEAIRKSRSTIVGLTAQVVQLSADEMNAMPGELADSVRRTRRPDRPAVALDAKSMAELSQRLKGMPEERLSTSRITMFSQQRACVHTGSEIAAIGEYRLGEEGKWEPVRGAIKLGTLVDARPVVSDDRSQLAVHARLEVAWEVARSQVPFEPARDEKLLVDRVEVERLTLDRLLLTRSGESVILFVGDRKTQDAKQSVFLILTGAAGEAGRN
jgi:hypothetical protein